MFVITKLFFSNEKSSNYISHYYFALAQKLTLFRNAFHVFYQVSNHFLLENRIDYGAQLKMKINFLHRDLWHHFPFRYQSTFLVIS